MTRSRRREWKNGRDSNGNYVPFTVRIIWFGEGDNGTDNIRLQLEDSVHKVSIYPKTEKVANHIWYMFRRQASPPPGDVTPCVEDLIELIRGRIDVKIPEFWSLGGMSIKAKEES